ncbi:MAG: flagellar biosynthesis protein FlhB [Calditrichia bacterium]
MADDFQEKTEQATPRRKDEARKKGQVARSMEINSAAMLLLGLLIINFSAGYIYSHIKYAFFTVFHNLQILDINPQTTVTLLQGGVFFMGKILGPIIFGFFLIGIAASYGQVGFAFSPEAIKPKFEKLNPVEGIKKVLFSRRTIEELIKNLIKVSIILWVAYSAIRNKWDEFFLLLDQDISQIFTFILSSALEVSLKIAIAFIFIAAADFAFQRWDHSKKLMMSKQEVKDENKQTEGDPQIKSAIRKKQLQMAVRRMMQEVPKADVVIANPTHYAIALKYDNQKMDAPLVVAKGKDEIALRIRQIAEENDVPIVEDPPLARALFDAVEIDRPIPEKFFQAVAEVLAYVYKLKGKAV